MTTVCYPSLYQINTRVWLTALSRTLDRPATLYKSYQARGYIQFLGNEAKRGNLREAHLPLVGWPKKRIKDWRRNVWVCPWLGQAGDLLEPYLFLPSLLILAWLLVVLRRWTRLDTGVLLILALVLVALLLWVFCIAWVWSQRKDEE